MNANGLVYDTLDEAKRNYYLYRQAPDEDNEQHARAFKENVDVVKHLKGSLFDDESLIEYEKQKDIAEGITGNDDAHYAAVVKEKSMGTALKKGRTPIDISHC